MTDIGEDFVFTRYLYVEEDVCHSLATNLLLKNTDKARFWAMELLHSGLTDTLISILWNAYFNYYFSLNPEFYNYLLKQTKRLRGCTTDSNEAECATHDIIANLMIRPFNIDVLRSCMTATDTDDTIPFFPDYTSDQCDIMITDSPQLNSLLLDGIAPTNCKKILTLFRNLDKLRTNPHKLAGGEIGVPEDVERVARLALVGAYARKLKMGKKLFVPAHEHDGCTGTGTGTGTSTGTVIRADKILQHVTVMSMSEEKSFCKYDDNGDTSNDDITPGASDAVRRAYGFHWEYYAHRSPLWAQRIAAHGGAPDDDSKRIVWTAQQEHQQDDEQFYEKYGYDPDEQSSEVVCRNLAIGLRRKTPQEYFDMVSDACANGLSDLVCN